MKCGTSSLALAALAPFALGLAGCATTATADSDPAETGEVAMCDAASVQDWIGQTASPELGAELLAATGAKTLRWGPPRSAMTMDYRPDRLTVTYDDNMVIDRISCG
ncbi:I78 family peptidase inhibitor [Croceicoccus sp. Ery15]|uniref:I78 family peptidase inhibitor n=1 Tax=Croceicoccus sp. Ery15 TaxID=1703338 RepID=UPI001E490B1F|nr:I78 family peptidase inhibitor [Croceicoccus sp. Ery15]